MVRRLLALSGLAAIVAVSHHTVSWSLTAMFWWADRYKAVTVPDYTQIGTFGFFAVRFIDQFVFAVPAFLFVSGYFISTAAGTSTGTVGWGLLRNRIKALLPPYLIWSAVAMILNLYNGETYTASRLVWELLTGGASAPFYYIPLLVELYVLSRWLVPVARNHWLALLLVTAAAQLAVVAVRSCALLRPDMCSTQNAPWLVHQLQNSQLAAYWFWFIFGLVVGQHLAAYKAHMKRLKPFMPALVVAVYAVAFVEWETLRAISGRPWVTAGVTLGDNLASFVLLLAFTAYDDLVIPYASALSRIGALSFGIYLVHNLVLEVVARVIYHVAPALLAYTIVFHILLVVVALTLPILLMQAVKASPLKRYYAYAFG